ncbi:MAG: AMP-binding protein [Bacteroidia bacterium]
MITPLGRLYQWERTQPAQGFLHQPIDGTWHTWTWGEAAREVRRMAAAIQAKGYEPGSRIAILSRNCAHWIMADLAIMMSGHISVPIYPNINAETVRYVLTHSEARLIFVGKLEQHDWDEMRPGIPDEVERISFGRYALQGADYPDWDTLVRSNEPLTGSPDRSLDEVMTIIYTSGTTGRPKGVVLKFEAPVFAFEGFQHHFHIQPQDRFFSYLPLSHIAERMLVVMGSLRGGAHVYFAQSLDTFADNLRHAEPTLFLGVPRIWTKFQSGVLAKFPPSRLNLLLSLPLIRTGLSKLICGKLGLGKARVLLTGAAPTPKSLLEWYSRLGMHIYEVYGMTENSAYSHANTPEGTRFGTVGRPMIDTTFKLTAEGEICIKSLANMSAYYKEPELTAEVLRDGFLHTGDKGEVDADGFVRITGRVKDLFKTSKAKYVVPAPIEMLLSKDDHIEQVCVVGSGLPQPLALVVLSETARKRTRDEVAGSLRSTLAAVNSQLEDHERLQNLVVVREDWTTENGVLTPTLKIKRGAVDDRYTPSYERWYEGGKGTVIWEN